MSDVTGVSSGGYICPNCQQWVPYNSIHVCPKVETLTLTAIPDQEIISRLDQIIDLLNELLRRVR